MIYNMESYQNLAIAIIQQAASDYENALFRIQTDETDKYAQEEIQSIERFFQSEWFGILTDLKPEYLMQQLYQKVMKNNEVGKVSEK